MSESAVITDPKISDKVSTFYVEDGWPGADAVMAYKRDGVVCLRGAFGPDWLAVIEEGIDEALSGASTNLDIVKKKGDAGSFSVSSQAWRQVRPFRRFIFDSHIADIAWPFLESSSLTLFYDFLLIKQAHSDSAATPWHQDHAYYPLNGKKVINCWTALDSIPIETALRFYRGSHSLGVIHQATNFENPAEDYKHLRRERAAVPNIDADPSAEIIATAMEPGDMLVWNSHTFHSAPGNSLDRRRAAFSVNWVGDDVTYDDVPALDTYRHPELKTGDRITCDKFPLVRGIGST
ncbi:MAG: phytanoyl-CoA dioxygenase family protein [Gammaproteobacteria bacterium]|nr:phytanoyl-CoA dioxygenase family protein [Gammaproteobacteria bacterium]